MNVPSESALMVLGEPVFCSVEYRLWECGCEATADESRKLFSAVQTCEMHAFRLRALAERPRPRTVIRLELGCDKHSPRVSTRCKRCNRKLTPIFQVRRCARCGAGTLVRL